MYRRLRTFTLAQLLLATTLAAILLALFASVVRVRRANDGAVLSAVGALAFSPDAKTLAVGLNYLSADLGERGEVRIFDVASGARKGPLLKPQNRDVSAVASGPDGEMLASAGQDDRLRLWSMRTGRQRASIASNGPTHLAFAADGKRLVMVNDLSGSVAVWNVGSDQAAEVPTQQYRAQASIACPDGRLLVAGVGEDDPHTLYLLDGMSDRILHTFAHGTEVWGAAFLPDGKTVVSVGFDVVKLWDAKSGRELFSFPYNNPMDLAISSNGQWLAVASATDPGVVVCDLGLRCKVATLPVDELTVALAISPDGRFVAVGHLGSLQFWDVATGTPLPQVYDLSPQRERVPWLLFGGALTLWVVACVWIRCRRGGRPLGGWRGN